MLIFDVKFTTVFVCFAMAMISGCHHSPQLANTNQGSDSSESGHFFKPTIEYWKRINQDENHQIPYANIIRARQQAKEHQARAQTMPQDRSVPSGTWVFRGPDNWSGRTRSLLIDPRNSNSMLAGGVTGGLWHSDDGGSNWSPVTEGLSSLEICALTRDPQNLDTIYLGTGEAPLATQPVGDTDEWIAPYVFGGEGIFKSTDNGQTWSNLNSTST
ncbi:MAG: hypothetical protein VX527_00705, partial [Planctomycetota bacterium]|nr:hypothetical protein [Planctomycetota bacterium]